MDLNVYNGNIINMNPSDYGMVWMNQFSQERLIFDESNLTSFYGQPTIGMSILDDLSQHQISVMDMNPMMGIMSDYTTTTTTGGANSITMTPELFALSQQSTEQLYQQQQQGLALIQSHLDGTATDPHVTLKFSCTDDDDDAATGGAAPQSMMCYEDDDGSGEIDDCTMDEYHTAADDLLTQSCDTMTDIGINVQYQDDDGYDDDNEMIVNASGFMIGIESEHIDTDTVTISSKSVNKKSIATQVNKKIKPVKRPGLILKTPIAYQPCQDPSVIPIQRDGMAVCQRCGAVGVKHSFYTRERRFCSMACARKSYASTNDVNLVGVPLTDSDDPKSQTYNIFLSKTNGHKDHHQMHKELLPQQPVPEVINHDDLPTICPEDEKIVTVRRKPSDYTNTFDWTGELSKSTFFAAPISCFKHAPGYEMSNNFTVGIKVEVENTDTHETSQIVQQAIPHSFWVASVLQIQGYKAKLRYEGFDTVGTRDFWVNLCSSEVHPVGWCAIRGKPLIPPKTIEHKYRDWKDFLMERLSGARTLPQNFYNKINDSSQSRFRVGLRLEVIDKMKLSQMKLAVVNKIVGKRLFVKYLKYLDSQPYNHDDNGFWCHEDSQLIHPVGWSAMVGHALSAPQEYIDRMAALDENTSQLLRDDATMDLFKMNFNLDDYLTDDSHPTFEVGMKIEAVDPLNLSSICVATVMSVLKFGYMMIRVESYDTEEDWFCYHEKTPYIFPPGFCEENDIKLTPPHDYEKETFLWPQYLKDTGGTLAPDELFTLDTPQHGFTVGMKLESADLMTPRMVGIATVKKVVGRLLRIHFDGWDEEYDQWLDCDSPDLYPVGWCVLVGHKLEGPPVEAAAPKTTPKSASRKKKKKTEIVKTGKPNTGHPTPGRPKLKKEPPEVGRSNKKGVSGKIKTTPVKRPVKTPTIDSEDNEEEDNEELTQTTSTSRSSIVITPELSRKDTPTFDKQKRESSQGLTVSTIGSQSQSSSPQPPPPQERKATSYINNSTISSTKFIPRLNDTRSTSPDTTPSVLCPVTWNVYDVAQFLRVNDCTAHCDTFVRHKIDGKRMLALTKDEIIKILNMKVGPSLKIFDLIQQLKCRVDPNQSRLKKSSKQFL